MGSIPIRLVVFHLIASISSYTVLSKVIHLTPGSTAFPGAQNHYIITLMQWQFWWWFWFTGMLTIYNSLYSRFFYNRLPYLAPKIVTSYRSHGRWGDLIICIIPVGWCMNILSNSHFLLRALEWQTETAPFFLRVRGKQWYWIYKIDLNNFSAIEDIPKIIGRGKKVQFEKGTHTSNVVSQNFTELGYVENSRQEQIFLKINNNANKDHARLTQVVNKGRTGLPASYKKPFDHVHHVKDFRQLSESNPDVMSDPSQGSTDLELIHPEGMAPPLSLIEGGVLKMCAHYWSENLTRPGLPSDVIGRLFKCGKESSQKLLWVLTYRIVLKDQMSFCRRSHIAGTVPLLTPIFWPIHTFRVGWTESPKGTKFCRIHVSGIPQLGTYVRETSMFSDLHDGSCSQNHIIDVYGLLSKYVDFSYIFDKIVKVSFQYKKSFCKKVRLLSTGRLKDLWSYRVCYVKKNLLFSKLYLTSFLYNKKLLTSGWLDLYRVSRTLKLQNKNVMERTSAPKLYWIFSVNIGRSVYKNVVLVMARQHYLAKLLFKWTLLATIYPRLENPYLEIFLGISRFERRHLIHKWDNCARIIKSAFWDPQLGVFTYLNTLAKLIKKTSYSWAKYILFYTSGNLLLEIVGLNNKLNGPTEVLDTFIRTRSASPLEVRTWYLLQRGRSLNRWSRSNDLLNLNFILFKSPLSSKKPLTLGYYCPDENPTKMATQNVSITIKQKKIEKTVFNAKLDDREYSVGDEKGVMVYNKLSGTLQLVPGYNHTHKDIFRSGGGTRVGKTDGPTINKSYLNNKRLLWVNKLLLLPTHVAITIVTNSYDVIHSWFIPGLGLKLDCVPGRSTHHTIYVEYGGYYYGQCAEVCGRRHHHMPIKIRAIPFMIFSYWWRNQIREDFLKELQ